MTELRVNATTSDLQAIDPKRSLLGVLREELHLTGTKEGCGTGDCGACTVVAIDHSATPPTAHTLNSCITPLGAVLGRHIITCEGLADGEILHPVQQAMVDEHGSQCGFCTPGFVMSLVGAQLQTPPGDSLEARSQSAVIQSISGNLCRCTGYRPIIAAAHAANTAVANSYPTDAGQAIPALRANGDGEPMLLEQQTNSATSIRGYAKPTQLTDLNDALGTVRPNAQWAFVAGSTDLWLAVTQHYKEFDELIDLSEVAELQGITQSNGSVRIGAAVTHAELLDYFEAAGANAIVDLLRRFGSPQVRSRGTIGGNIANASPIADWPPILLALNASLTIGNADGSQRRLDLADFYLGYKKTELAHLEYLICVEFDVPPDWTALHAHKISKRWDDDISSVFGAFYLRVENARLAECRIAYGGIAATPVRLVEIEALLIGARLAPGTAEIEAALSQLAQHIQPLTDVRASAAYRREMSVNILRNALRQLAANQ